MPVSMGPKNDARVKKWCEMCWIPRYREILDNNHTALVTPQMPITKRLLAT